jgi:hypothetical protein
MMAAFHKGKSKADSRPADRSMRSEARKYLARIAFDPVCPVCFLCMVLKCLKPVTAPHQRKGRADLELLASK